MLKAPKLSHGNSLKPHKPNTIFLAGTVVLVRYGFCVRKRALSGIKRHQKGVKWHKKTPSLLVHLLLLVGCNRKNQ